MIILLIVSELMFDRLVSVDAFIVLIVVFVGFFGFSLFYF